MSRPAGRDLDLVLVGATGFSGALTAEYLVEAAPPATRWALAGRNPAKLAALRDRLGADVEILEADAADRAGLRRLAERCGVVVSAVGPYIRHGEPLVAACAETGTDYVDLAGEPEFVDIAYLRHHATAARTGARLVHACGFDSVPYDLGVHFTVGQLPADLPIEVRGYVRAGGALSGGTFDSAVTSFSRFRRVGAAHAARRAREPRPTGRRARGVRGRPGYDSAIGAWVLPLATIDPQIVVRSARVLDRYGPDFRYVHYAALRSPVTAAGLALGLAGAFALAQTPPTRRLLTWLRPAGSGPSAARRERGWFRVRFVARSGDRRLDTEVAGGDPYAESAAMLAESALCLAHDELSATAGQLTPAVAMGDALRTRLEKAGLSFRVLDDGEPDWAGRRLRGPSRRLRWPIK